MAKKSGRPPNTYPYLDYVSGPVFRPNFDTVCETVSLEQMGQFRSVNGVAIGPINPDWVLLEAYTPAPIDGEKRQLIERLLLTFAEEQAGEIGSMPWSDLDKDGLLKRARLMQKATKSLVEAVNPNHRATCFIRDRIERMNTGRFDGGRFSWDEFYPLLTQLHARAHDLLNELEAEKRRGVKLGIGNAWRRFVFGIATLYQEIGGDIATPEISERNEYEIKESSFLRFAHAAMMQVPENLRIYTTGGGKDGIHSFSDRLSEAVTKLGLRELPKKNRESTVREKNSGRPESDYRS